MRNHSLGRSAAIIPYYKELNNYTGSVTSTILMLQLEYWFSKTDGHPFFKFLEPCDHKGYREGDSWVEDLGFTKYEFRTAFEKIGKVYKSKNEYLNSEDKFSGKLYLSFYDRQERRTYYVRNHEQVDKILDEWISRKSIKSTSRSGESQSLEVDKVNLQKSQKSTSRSGQCQSPYTVDYYSRLQQENTSVDYTEDTYINSDELNASEQISAEPLTTSENKKIHTPHQKIVDMFNTICITLPKVQVISDSREKAMRNIWKFAKEDIGFFETLFNKVEHSDFLCGRNGEWKAGFDWIMKQRNTIKILEGNYDNKGRVKNNSNESVTDRLNTDAVKAFLSKGE